MEPAFILQFFVNLLELFRWLLLARIIMSWFPSIDWGSPPWRYLNDVTEPVMTPFRRLIPPIGGLDLSPILLFFALDLAIGLLRRPPMF